MPEAARESRDAFAISMKSWTDTLKLMAACGLAAASLAQTAVPRPTAKSISALGEFQAIEFRRYTIKPGQRKNFATYFESYFPEAFEQLGSVAAGSFLERDHANGFTWIRGFHNIEDRAIVNAQFYYGPLWKQHRDTMNDLLDDSDNVLLLRPLSTERALAILPAVDPVTEASGASGVVVAEIFAVKPDSTEAFAREAEAVFGSYRAAGAREAGVLGSLDVKNNFPQLPVRTDGPYVVWLGILKDDAMLTGAFRPAVENSKRIFAASTLLRGEPELVVMDPTPRSRMRWLP
jgi:NIPSNAP